MPDALTVWTVLFNTFRGRIQAKDHTSPHVGDRQRPRFLVDLKARKRGGNAERPRCSTR